jgi:glycyl-tRNA synthetase beta chain
MKASLLIEIGCEEIPARMIPAAASDLGARVAAILDQAALGHGAVVSWGGTRRLAVRVDAVEARQPDRREQVLGPPASAAFGKDGAPTPAAMGFAKKQGIDPGALRRIDTDRGSYAGFDRETRGKGVGEVLAGALPQAIAGMSFPKTMRWADGAHRWVRPVHWVLALHGSEALPLEVFGVRAGVASTGHRFLAPGPVPVNDPDAYRDALRQAFVLVDPGERRSVLRSRLDEAARASGGTVAPDEALLEEVVDLVEWPGVVAGRFDETFLRLPREILVTTLRHHQKAFSVQKGGTLLPVFLAVANTDRDPGQHVRRGNEWVVSGRLEDARFFWEEDRKTALASRVEALKRVTFQQKAGSYWDKAQRMQALAGKLADAVGLAKHEVAAAREAARLAKADLVTGLVGEFPELQGIAGGLLLRAEGGEQSVATGIYEQYRPAGPDDSVPASTVGAVVSVADKLDTLASLTAAGEIPTGSRDPFGLRRAAAGVFRIVLERRWPLSIAGLVETGRFEGAGAFFLAERFRAFLLERGHSANEVSAVLRPSAGDEQPRFPIEDVVARLDAIGTVRGRENFEHLVDLTKRVDNILVKNADASRGAPAGHVERDEAALALARAVEDARPRLARAAEGRSYAESVEIISSFVAPVETFFEKVLVIDPENLPATRARCELLRDVREVLTSHFDIRELAGQADRRT